jgi:hypothetical protein
MIYVVQDSASRSTGVQSLFGNRRIRGIPNAYQQRLRPSGNFTHTRSFQYSLTSYLHTSSTQVVSRPCRGISRL